MVCISNRLLKVFVAERSLDALRLVEMTVERMLSQDDWRVFVMSTAVETSRSSDATYPPPASPHPTTLITYHFG